MDLLTGLTAVSQTIAITKDLRNIDDKIVVAEFKLRIADIVDKLLDAKQALQDAQEERRQLIQQIEILEESLRFKKRLTDEKGKLFVLNELGQTEGEPFCNQCYVKEGKLYRMLRQPGEQGSFGSYWCSNCKDTFYD